MAVAARRHRFSQNAKSVADAFTKFRLTHFRSIAQYERMKVGLCFFVCCLSLLAVPRRADAAQEPWTEIRSPHFRVLTNGDTADARHVAHEFEQMRYVFAMAFPKFRLDTGADLTIFAVRDESTAKSLEPAIWKMKGGSRLASFIMHGRKSM